MPLLARLADGALHHPHPSSLQHSVRTLPCPQLCVVDGRAIESLLAAGGGTVAADADLDRITLLLNQQASGSASNGEWLARHG